MTTPLPDLLLADADASTLVADALVVGLGRDGDDVVVRASLGSEVDAAIVAAARAIGFRGTVHETARIPAPAGVTATSVLLVGLGVGSTDALEARDALRAIAGTALRTLRGVEAVALALPAADEAEVDAIAIGALLGAYRHTALRTRDVAAPVASIAIVAPADAQPVLDRAAVVARAVADARDLVNASPLELHPAAFADAIVAQAADPRYRGAVDVHVVDEHELRERGFGGLVGVGSGSPRGPRLVRVSYAPKGAVRHLSVVGKGITFDSGGLSIKPATNMERMKSDMAGAAAAAHAVLAIAELGLPIRATAWLALAENMPSGSAMRPSDVLRIYGGTTVEVTNTDAEGRLVLADALVAAQEERPDLLVDVATLTGAQVQALGRRTSGVMGTPDARDRVVRASAVAGEPMWGMPIPPELIRAFDSATADLRNAGAKAGGMLAAAAFLREFVADGVAWAHLDIAGPAFEPDAAHGCTPIGGTGCGVRTLVELAQAEVEASVAAQIAA